MSERKGEHYDENTPEDRLTRYRWALSRLDEAGPELIDTEKVYVDAILGMGAVLEALGIDDPHQRNIILGSVVPGPFDMRLRNFDDWLVDLRLMPLRLIDKEVPPLESYTARYLMEAFATALDEEPSHGADCMGEEGGGCTAATSCPAKVAAEIGLRQLGLLVFDQQTLVLPQDMPDVKRGQDNIAQLVRELDHYGLAEEVEVQIAINEMDRLANDILRAIIKPKHRKQE